MTHCPPHHWLLEEAAGQEWSMGTCRHCHAERQFRNWQEEWIGGDDRFNAPISIAALLGIARVEDV